MVFTPSTPGGMGFVNGKDPLKMHREKPIGEADTSKRLFIMRLSSPLLARRSSLVTSPSRLRTLALFSLTIVLVSVRGVTSAFAAETVTTQLSALKRVETKDKQGHVTVSFVAFNKALPGDDVVYTVTCHNQGEAPANNIVITLPIPAELTFVPGSATGDAEVTYSVDGGKTFDLLENLVITAPDGASRPARVGDINMIGWKLRSPLAPASDAQVSFHASVK